MQDNEILMLPNECWRWVPSYEGLYQVSTRGRVRSVDRWVDGKNGSKQFREGRILKTQRNDWGYLEVELYRDGKRRTFLVHRLVAEAFIPNPENKPEVNHLNEQKDMNFAENLSWATRKENNAWGTGNKRRAASKINGSLSKPVQAVGPKTGVVVMEFPSMMEAERNGFHSGAISECCRGKRRTHRGFAWSYKES